MDKIIVIYHRSDFDGICCRYIAEAYFGKSAEYIGWEYNDPIPKIPAGSYLYMLDIAIHELMDHPRLCWIDHHISSIRKYGKRAGFQIDGVAACRLAYQWFFTEGSTASGKEHYTNRSVKEPLFVRMLGEYDVWDHRDPRGKALQLGLRACNAAEFSPEDWIKMIRDEDPALQGIVIHNVCVRGAAVQTYLEKQNRSVVKHRGFVLSFEGLHFAAVNAAGGNSLVFDAVDTAGLDGLLIYGWVRQKGWVVSMYGVPGRKVDLSTIAVKYGGGGHAGACGFTVENLPFAVDLTLPPLRLKNQEETSD